MSLGEAQSGNSPRKVGKTTPMMKKKMYGGERGISDAAKKYASCGAAQRCKREKQELIGQTTDLKGTFSGDETFLRRKRNTINSDHKSL